MNEIQNVKYTIFTYIFGLLKSKWPQYFNHFKDETENKINTYYTVYWADTRPDRPNDAVECLMRITGDAVANTRGSDGPFHEVITTSTTGSTSTTYVTDIIDTHIITVKFAINAMRKENKQTGQTELSDLEADNLALSAASYLRLMLKSTQSSNYFLYDNEIFTPIFVLSTGSDLSDIDEAFEFEDTRGSHTYQFTCNFSFDVTEAIDSELAKQAHVYVNDDTGSEAQEFTIKLIDE